MYYNPKAIANYYLSTANDKGQKINAMRMIKLVYLAHAWHLALTKEPLINEVIVADEYGPSIRTLREGYRKCGMDDLKECLNEVDAHGNLYTPHVERTDKRTQDILKQVWDVYKEHDHMNLSVMLRENGSPWDTIHEDNEVMLVGLVGTVIPNDVIREYYSRLAEGYAGDCGDDSEEETHA